MQTLNHPFRRLLLPGLAAGALLFAACGDDDDSASAPAPADDSSTDDTSGDSGGDSGGGPVEILDFKYGPMTITAGPGEEITFDNADNTAHTATAQGQFDSGSIAGGESGTITAPDEPGEYPFICSFHPFMEGTIVVE